MRSLWEQCLDPLLHLLITRAKSKTSFFRKGQRLTMEDTVRDFKKCGRLHRRSYDKTNHLESVFCCSFHVAAAQRHGRHTWPKIFTQTQLLAEILTVQSSSRDTMWPCVLHSRCSLDSGGALIMSVTVISSACHNALRLAWLNIKAKWEAERATGYHITTNTAYLRRQRAQILISIQR